MRIFVKNLTILHCEFVENLIKSDFFGAHIHGCNPAISYLQRSDFILFLDVNEQQSVYWISIGDSSFNLPVDFLPLPRQSDEGE